VIVTLAPMSIAAVQPLLDPLEQSMPGPLTNPPGDVTLTVSGYVDGSNVAVAVRGLVILIVQVAPLPEGQPPDQLLNREPGAGSATSVTVAPFATEVEQPAVEPVVQLRPDPVTVPLAPERPEEETVSRYSFSSNDAVAVFAPVIVTVQVAPLTDVQPDQLLNRESGAGSATSVTVAPFSTEVEQPDVEPVVQLSPGPLIVPLAP